MPSKEDLLQKVEQLLDTLNVPQATVKKIKETSKYLVDNLDTSIVKYKHTDNIATAIIQLACESEGVYIKIKTKKDIIARLRQYFNISPPEIDTLLAKQLKFISNIYSIDIETESRIFQKCKELLRQLKRVNPSCLSSLSIISYVLFKDPEFSQLKKKKKLKLVHLSALFGLNDAAIRSWWSAHGLTKREKKKEREDKIPIPKSVLSDAPVIKISPLTIDDNDEEAIGFLGKLKRLLR